MKKIEHRIRLVCILLLAFGLCFGAPAAAHAAEITLDMEYTFSGFDPGGTSPWLTAIIDDEGSPGSVRLELIVNDLEDDEFVSRWYFNLDPALDPEALVIAYDSGGPPLPPNISISTGTDAFKADGDGFFDILFEFPNPMDRFDTGSVVYDITSTETITALSFYFESTPKPNSTVSFLSAAHVQGFTDPGQTETISGWIAAVPIPGSVLLLSSGLIGLIFLRRKRLVK